MPKKYIVLDTETTGLETEQGHRIIEIGALLLEDRKKTDNHFHVYLNPERLIDEEAQRVHGISNKDLVDKPLYKGLSTKSCLLYTSPSPRDATLSRMPSSA